MLRPLLREMRGMQSWRFEVIKSYTISTLTGGSEGAVGGDAGETEARKNNRQHGQTMTMMRHYKRGHRPIVFASFFGLAWFGFRSGWIKVCRCFSRVFWRFQSFSPSTRSTRVFFFFTLFFYRLFYHTLSSCLHVCFVTCVLRSPASPPPRPLGS